MKAYLSTILKTAATLTLAVLIVLPASAQNWRNIEGDIDPSDIEWVAPEVEQEQDESGGGSR